MQKIQAVTLVIDDQEEMLELCSRVLEDVVTEVVQAPSVAAARAAFHKRPFDLVLTDINIDADGDGVMLAREIKNMSPDTKVVMMTADPTIESAIGGIKTGAMEYIIKPFSADYLASVIRAAFDKAALSSELAREKAIKRELEDAYARLKETESAKDAFLGRVNHELRTPLAIAVTSSEILGQQLSGEQRELWLRVDKALKWLHLGIGELLLYSGLLKGEIKVDRKETDLGALLEAAGRGLKFLFDEAGVTLAVSAEGTPAPVQADPELLSEVFRQLLANGVKFNKKGGGVAVKVSHLPDRAVLSFSNTGPEVGDEAMPHLFDNFFQAADYLTREVGGIGLGLATVKRIMEAHGGDVAARKNPGGGLSFILSLPRKPV